MAVKTSSECPRVLVVDNHPVYRDGLARALKARTDLRLLDEEIRLLDRFAEQAGSDAMSARKAARADHHMKARKRGRRR